MIPSDKQVLVVKNVFLNEDVSFSINGDCYMSIIKKIRKREDLHKKYNEVQKKLKDFEDSKEWKSHLARKADIDTLIESIRSSPEEDKSSAIDMLQKEVDNFKSLMPKKRQELYEESVDIDMKLTDMSYKIVYAILEPADQKYLIDYENKEDLIDDCVNTIADFDFVIAFFLSAYTSYTNSLQEMTFRLIKQE